MDAPPPHEDPKPFLDVAQWLTARGFPAPAIIGTDLTQGLVLLEDFGDARMRETVDAAPESLLRLYEAAVDILIAAARRAGRARGSRMTARSCTARPICWSNGIARRSGSTVSLDEYHAAWDAVFDDCAGRRSRSRCCATIMPKT